MKWIHTADWHLGKIVHGRHMTDDQRHVLFQSFLKIVDEEKPDAIVVAGDVFDRSVPPVEAVELLDDVWRALVFERNIPVLAVAGNHDSAERLHYNSSLLTQVGLHIVGKYTPDLAPVDIGGTPFYLMPFLEPARIRYELKQESIKSHEDAHIAVIERFGAIPKGAVAVGHSFVTGGLETDSERKLSVGLAGQVGAHVYEPFAYTALGHLHNPNALKHPTIAYSGSLLKYSFSEVGHEKSVEIIEMGAEGVSRRRRPLEPKRDMCELKGTLAELLESPLDGNVEDYLKIVLTDETTVHDPMHRLRQRYPNVLHLELEQLRRQDTVSFAKRDKIAQQSIADVFIDFYGDVHGKSMPETLIDVLKGEES